MSEGTDSKHLNHEARKESHPGSMDTKGPLSLVGSQCRCCKLCEAALEGAPHPKDNRPTMFIFDLLATNNLCHVTFAIEAVEKERNMEARAQRTKGIILKDIISERKLLSL